MIYHRCNVLLIKKCSSSYSVILSTVCWTDFKYTFQISNKSKCFDMHQSDTSPHGWINCAHICKCWKHELLPTPLVLQLPTFSMHELQQSSDPSKTSKIFFKWSIKDRILAGRLCIWINCSCVLFCFVFSHKKPKPKQQPLFKQILVGLSQSLGWQIVLCQLQ